MKDLIKKILREELLKEYQIYPYELMDESNNFIEYGFNVDNMVYYIRFMREQYAKTLSYILHFGIDDQEENYRTGRNLQHLNNVLYTIDNIVADAVKTYKIENIIFSGAREETDKTSADSIRTRTYLRFIQQKYPNAKIDKSTYGIVTVDMKSIYPQVF